MQSHRPLTIGLVALAVPACAVIALLIFSLATDARAPRANAGTVAGLAVEPLDRSQAPAASLAAALLGYPPPGPAGIAGGEIPYSNVTYTGSLGAAGTFSGGTGIIGFASGIILSSGRSDGVIGPNSVEDVSFSNETPGDAALDALVTPFPTQDAAVLEFDFVPAGNSIEFQYVFTSDEYNFYVHQEFNDVFGFFVNGVNCATVDGAPVSVDSINNGNPFGSDPREHPNLYINNDLDDGGGSINTSMNGLTVVLTCVAAVVPNQTNHIKLAAADTSDSILDTNVFLQAGSFVVVPTATLVATPTATQTPTPAGATATAAPPTVTATIVPPTSTPTNAPTAVPPTSTPTRIATTPPTVTATRTATRVPTTAPTHTPTRPPTAAPTNTPTRPPTATQPPPAATLPPVIPTLVPLGPGGQPATDTPTNAPSPTPTGTATKPPTATPTKESEVLGGVAPTPKPPSGPRSVHPAGFQGGGVEPKTTLTIPSPNDLSTNKTVIATNLVLAFILLITLLVSSTIFNSAIDENRDKILNFFNRLFAPLRRITVDASDAWQGIGLGGSALGRFVFGPAIVIVVSGLIYTFNQPGIGFNSGSTVLFLSLVIALGIATYVYEGGEALVTHRHFQTSAGVRVFAPAIAIAIVFVLLSRLVGFEAPVIYGFVASCALLAPVGLDKRQAAQAVSVPAVILLSLSMIAWALLIPLRHWAHGAGVWGQMPSEIAALVFAGGIEGLVFSMIPIRFTDGGKISSWNRPFWFLMMGVPLFVFCWTIVNPEAKSFDIFLHGRVRTVIGLVVAYAAVTAAVWTYFRVRDREEVEPPAGPPLSSNELVGETTSDATRAIFPLRANFPAATEPPQYPDLSRRQGET